MIVNGQAQVENVQPPPTYSIDFYEGPPVDFANQDAFFTKTADEASKTSAATNVDDNAADNATADDADDADDADGTDGTDGAEDDGENDQNDAIVKKRVAKKSQLEQLKKRKSELVNAAAAIYMFGLECKANIHEQAFNAAIPGLAMVLGTYRTFFDNANNEEREAFTKVLTQRCRVNLGKSSLTKADKRTTPFHLLSRLFRNSERRQASSDAKILRLAHKEGATQQSFDSWVKGYGSLSAILRKIRDGDAGQAETQPEKKRKEKPLTDWVKAAEVPEDDAAGALAALKKLADGKRYPTTIWHHHGRFDVMRLIGKSSAAATETKNEESESKESA